ncbi:DUF4079 domain-containing protein, partial [Moorena sp. SIO3I6]|uniref:DUF4079 domain-containing protein n=1 Tax=Moorena sp. SIO3I6 TaxID=2607831 RepID=UPI0025D07D17
SDHRKIAPWMFIFIAGGYTGGVLSLVMQYQPILESPHFWTGSIVLILLAANGVIALTGFGGNKALTYKGIWGSNKSRTVPRLSGSGYMDSPSILHPHGQSADSANDGGEKCI